MQWLICIGFGLLGNILSIFIKSIPEDKIFTCAIYENAGDEEEDGVEEDNAPVGEDEVAPLNSQTNNNNTGGNKKEDTPKKTSVEPATQKQPETRKEEPIKNTSPPPP
mmetsp:Transcript_21135/g.2830  ORF Transcript_21135/g.2830 Transcript_21135/m.2830 type:complete len:108 (-) Transcript_21135:413-736(-)